MDKKRIIFSAEEKETFSFDNLLNEISNTDPLFKPILKKEHNNDYCVSFDEEEKVELSSTMQLQVNISTVGSFHFVLNDKDINRKEMIQSVSELREMEVVDLESSKAKVVALFEIMKKYNLLFVLYEPKGNYQLSLEQLDFNEFIFYVKQENEVLEEPKPVVENKKEVTIVAKSNKKVGISKIFVPLQSDHIHYLFVVIATFLISFTIATGIYHMYKQNTIYIFFFVCTGIGAILNAFVYIDFFNKKNWAIWGLIWSIIFMGIGVLAGALGFYLFFSFQTENPESLSSPTSVMLIQSLLTVAVSVVTGFVGFGVSLLKKKDTKDEEE